MSPNKRARQQPLNAAVGRLDVRGGLCLNQRLLALWAADCAEHGLPLFEQMHPQDNRPRQAIEAARSVRAPRLDRGAIADIGSIRCLWAVGSTDDHRGLQDIRAVNYGLAPRDNSDEGISIHGVISQRRRVRGPGLQGLVGRVPSRGVSVGFSTRLLPC